MPNNDFQPSVAMREYLAEIYRLQEDSPTVSTTSLADRLHVSAPAVPRMLKRLRNAGYVKHKPYQGIELTPRGREEALRELRRHRILEVFLVNVMDFTWDEAHEHADEMGKGLNDAITQRMAEMTNNPSRCPHDRVRQDSWWSKTVQRSCEVVPALCRHLYRLHESPPYAYACSQQPQW